MDLVRREIHADVAAAQRLVARRRIGPAQQGANARQKLGRRKGLGDVVVRTAFKATDLVGFFAARGQDDDRRRPGFRLSADLAADFDRSLPAPGCNEAA
jgi:hypothetical protein